ncbi:hypothetical protein K6I34_006510, partial [Streptomyces sp. UNOC14_S4]|nr:hypothetical protein [Streptomyces sp. UNOC14_S4]
MTARMFVGACGLALMGAGAWFLLSGPDAQDPWEVAEWLGGFLLVHDALVVPLTLAAGFAVSRARAARGALRGAFLV